MTRENSLLQSPKSASASSMEAFNESSSKFDDFFVSSFSKSVSSVSFVRVVLPTPELDEEPSASLTVSSFTVSTPKSKLEFSRTVVNVSNSKF